jgi:hypothetical protein
MTLNDVSLAVQNMFKKKPTNVALTGDIPIRPNTPQPPMMPQVDNEYLMQIAKSKAKGAQSPQDSIMEYLNTHFNQALPQWENKVDQFYGKNPQVKGIRTKRQIQQTPQVPQNMGDISQGLIRKPNPQFQNDQWANQTNPIVPELYDIIMGLQNVPNEKEIYDIPEDQYIRSLMLELAHGESSGGRNLSGDNGASRGPYHIQRKDISPQDAMDFQKSSEYLLNEIKKNRARGKDPNEWLRSWNYWSGYADPGLPGYGAPKYDDDLIREATTSSFLRR